MLKERNLENLFTCALLTALYQDTKPQMSSSLVFKRVYRLENVEIQSVMLVFSTLFVNKRPSNLLTGSPPTPLPLSLCVTGGMGGYWSIGSDCVEIIYWSSTLCI
jgi:hypothetical protein